MSVATSLETTTTIAHTTRILVVEDERIVARSLCRQLLGLGYEVAGCVSSGAEAIQQTEDDPADLVLMDINLEGPMDGVEAAAIIRARFRIPVVYLTSYSNIEILERAKITEPFGYILKPYEERELHVVIETGIYKHRMERRQQEREQWFVATLQSIGDAVVATDEAGHVTYMNPLAEHLTGWTSGDALGQPLNRIVRIVQMEAGQRVETDAAQTSQSRTPNLGILLIAKDGSEKTIEDCISLITDEQGVAIGRVVVFRDVTLRKQLEEQLRRVRKMEAIGQLAGGMAHALNNLMTTVLGYSDLILNGMNPEDQFFASVQEIKRAATRTATLTQQLLAFSRKQFLTRGSVDVNAIVGGLAPVIRLLQGGVRLDLNLEPALGMASAEPAQLEDSILTLVRNACQAMPKGGELTIQTANVELGEEYASEHPEVRPGAYILLAVSDNGRGMDEEAISHLFEPFYTNDAGVGAGLGLAAVYGFVKQCGGDIVVRSQPQKGTTFRLYLPRHVRRLEVENS